jgi:hypothetical protein
LTLSSDIEPPRRSAGRLAAFSSIARLIEASTSSILGSAAFCPCFIVIFLCSATHLRRLFGKIAQISGACKLLLN